MWLLDDATLLARTDVEATAAAWARIAGEDGAKARGRPGVEPAADVDADMPSGCRPLSARRSLNDITGWLDS